MNARRKDLPHDPKAVADQVFGDALAVLRVLDVPMDVQVDRLVTIAAGAHVSLIGSALAARCFRDYAARIDSGLFAASEPTSGARN